MSHWQRPGADKTLPAGAKLKPFDRASDRIGPIEHPNPFFMLSRGFENVAQCRDERVNPAAQILQIDKQHIEAVHHRRGRPAHFAVKAENRDTVYRIRKI